MRGTQDHRREISVRRTGSRSRRSALPAGSAARRVDGLPILVVADNIVRGGAYRATGWEAASRTEENGGTILYRFLGGESDPELEKLFVDTRVTPPDRLGLKRWPSHGWAPRLTRAMPRATPPRPRT